MNEQIARALGWVKRGTMWCNADGELTIPYLGLIGAIPDFTTEREFSYILEDDIQARGLRAKYIAALAEIVPGAEWAPYENWGASQVWAFFRATPEQRARAYLKARGL